MQGINQVELIGRIGKKPEFRYTATGQPVSNFSIATEEYAGKDAPAHIEWHSVTVWNHHAEFAERHIDKGDLVRVEGSIRKEEYVDKENVKRMNVKIQGKGLMLLQKKGGGAASAPSSPAKEMSAPTYLLGETRPDSSGLEERAATEQPGELPF